DDRVGPPGRGRGSTFGCSGGGCVVVAHVLSCSRLQVVLVDLAQGGALVRCDMVGLVAADLVLGLVRACSPGVPLVLEVAGVHLDDRAGDVAGLGVPGYVVSDREFRAHALSPSLRDCSTRPSLLLQIAASAPIAWPFTAPRPRGTGANPAPSSEVPMPSSPLVIAVDSSTTSTKAIIVDDA